MARMLSLTNIKPLDGDGVTQVAAAPIASDGWVLVANHTYFFPIPVDGALVTEIHMKGVTALVITSAVPESSCFPDTATPIEVSNNWVTQNPAAATPQVTGGGWSQVANTVAASGAGAGAATWELGNYGGNACRLKVVVGATGGAVRVGASGKG